MDLPDDLPSVAISEEPLRQVLINLVMNAVQASDRDGVVRVGASATGDGVALTIEDEGVGIPEADRERVFEPFVTTREKGTGLGLSVVRKILTAHGATIGIGPGAERGTVVSVAFPVAERDDG